MNALSPSGLLARLPYDRPMLFLTDILEVDEEHIVGRYTFTDEDCAGHFRNEPVVPGVKIVECAAQTGCVAWGLYHLSRLLPPDELASHVGLFTSIERAVFSRALRPGQAVRTEGRFGDEGYFRKNKLVVEVAVTVLGGKLDGEEVFRGLIAGVWVPRELLDEATP